MNTVSCPLSHVSCAVSAADLIDNNLANLAVLWSKLVDLGKLLVLMLLADFKHEI